MADKVGLGTMSGVPGEVSLGGVTSDEAKRRYDQRVIVSEAKNAKEAGYSDRTTMNIASDTARGLGAETTTFKNETVTSEPEPNTEEQK